MKSNIIISNQKIDLEISIKLLEYLKRNNIIDNDMYQSVINKLLN